MTCVGEMYLTLRRETADADQNRQICPWYVKIDLLPVLKSIKLWLAQMMPKWRPASLDGSEVQLRGTFFFFGK
jgi:hypothetical protein